MTAGARDCFGSLRPLSKRKLSPLQQTSELIYYARTKQTVDCWSLRSYRDVSAQIETTNIPSGHQATCDHV